MFIFLSFILDNSIDCYKFMEIYYNENDQIMKINQWKYLKNHGNIGKINYSDTKIFK